MTEPGPRAMELFFEVFEALPRQGPGSRACAERALAACAGLPRAARALDLGCGAGVQTLYLAELLEGPIVALDRHAPNVDALRARLAERGLAQRVEARVGDMAAFADPEPFDLVWSEGALYSVGLDVALPVCRRVLRPGGHLAFTDAVWRVDAPSPETRAVFEPDYPTMGRAQDVVATLATHGFACSEHFTLPDAAWWDEFYTPLERRVDELRGVYARDVEALALLDEIASETDLHRRFGHEYAYEFFVCRLETPDRGPARAGPG